jgi:hypothetical protein
MLRLIETESRSSARAPFAHGLVHTDSAGYEDLDANVFEFDLGCCSNELQVWLYDPDFNGSSGMMPRNRRFRDGSRPWTSTRVVDNSPYEDC